VKLFLKHTGKEPWIDKAATGIAGSIIRIQKGFSRNMNQLTKRWKLQQQRVFLLLVCLFFGGLSFFLIINSFNKTEVEKSIIPKSISTPRNMNLNENSILITQNEFQQVQQFKRLHPNLQNERAGLFDTLSLLEQIYYSQKK